MPTEVKLLTAITAIPSLADEDGFAPSAQALLEDQLPSAVADFNENVPTLNELLTQAPLAIQAAEDAVAAALTAVNAPGTQATSTTSLSVTKEPKSLTIQPGKTIVGGMSVVLAYSLNPTIRMGGVVTAYDSGTGSLTVNVTTADGTGTYAAWTVSLGYMPSSARIGQITFDVEQPAGSLPCDGAQYAATSYPTLAAKLTHTAFKLSEQQTSPINGSIQSIAYNGTNLYVACGNKGICTSPDGVTWTDRYFVSSTLYNVYFANGVWIVPASDGVLRSTDGINWTFIVAQAGYNMCAAAFGNNTWVLCNSGSAYVHTSTDNGLTWTSRAVGNLASFMCVKYLNGYFILCGSQAYGSLWSSPDGITWTQRGCANSYYVYDVIYANSLYVVCTSNGGGNIYTTPDLSTWTSRASSGGVDLFRVIYAESLFVAVGGSGKITTSTDGATWTTRTSGTTVPLRNIAHNGTDFIIATAAYRLVLKSADGLTWTNIYGVAHQSPGMDYGCTPLVYLGSQFLSGGNTAGAIATSTDGTTWTVRRGKTFNGVQGLSYSTTAGKKDATDGVYYGVAGGGGCVLFSSDGETWTPSFVNINGVSALMFSEGVWIASCGAGGIWTSPDRANWTQRTTDHSTTIAWSGAVYVSIGNNGSGVVCSATSPIGTWTNRGTLGIGTLYNVVWCNGLFVLGTNGGYALTSPDGITWTVRQSAPSTTYQILSLNNLVYTTLNSGSSSVSFTSGAQWTPVVFFGQSPSTIEWLAYGNGVWVLVGGTSAAGVNPIWWSSDGVNFFPARASETLIDDICHVTFTNGKFYATSPFGLFVSVDGKNWFKYWLSGATYGRAILVGTRLAIVGASGNGVLPEDTTKFAVPMMGELGAPAYIAAA